MMKTANEYGRRTQGVFQRTLILLLIASLLLTAGCAPKVEDPTQPPETNPSQETDPVQTDPPVDVDPTVSLVLFRQGMVDTPYAFAAAYFGYQFNPDYDGPVDPFAVMAEEAPQLCADLPFVTAIPQENVVGGDFGELFCIVPRDEDAAVSINRGVWDDEKEAFVYEDVIYRGDSGAPVLLFCNSDGWAPDTQVNVTCSDGSTVTWYPTMDVDLRCIAPLRDDDWNDLLWDFSPYAESLAKDYREFAAEGWEHPTEEDLIGVTWGYYSYLEGNRKAAYQVTFQEDTCTVRWSDGMDEIHEYQDAAWELTREGDFTILSIDFREFAGVLRYNLLIEREYALLYTIVDASEGFVQAGLEPLDQLLEPIAPAPDPSGMVGAWELAWTEVEGDRNEADAGRMTIVITEGGGENRFRISMTDNAIPELSFKNKELTVLPGALFDGCGNDEWTGHVDYVGLYDTLYSLTLLEDGTLLVQDYWEFDGMQMVSYGWYRRVG